MKFSQYKSVVFLDDILRKEFWQAKEFVYGLIKKPIQIGSNLPVLGSPRLDSISWKNKGFDIDVFHKIIADLNLNWIDCYRKIPDQAAELLSNALQRDSIYVGYEMPIWLIELFNSNEVTYIDVRLSPIRFSTDLCFAINSNNQLLREKLSAFEIPYDYFRIEAGHIQATLLHLNGIDEDVKYDNSLIYVGQTNVDASLLMSNIGRVERPIDFAEKLKNIRNKFEKIYYLPHPYAEGRAEQELFELESILEEKISVCDIQSYELLCEQGRIGFVAISSGYLQEAKCFDREVFFLSKPICPVEGDGRHYNIGVDDLSDPFFWGALLPMKGFEAPSFKEIRKSTPNQLRLMHNAWWGYADLMLKNRTHYKDIIKYGYGAELGELLSVREDFMNELKSLTDLYSNIQAEYNETKISFNDKFNHINILIKFFREIKRPFLYLKRMIFSK